MTVVLATGLGGGGLQALALDVDHPFVFWDKEELGAIKQRIETVEWAKAKWQRKPKNSAEQALRDLLGYRPGRPAVLGRSKFYNSARWKTKQTHASRMRGITVKSE